MHNKTRQVQVISPLGRYSWSDREDVCAHVAHPDGLGHVVLEYGHVLVGALGAEKATAVATAKNKES